MFLRGGISQAVVENTLQPAGGYSSHRTGPRRNGKHGHKSGRRNKGGQSKFAVVFARDSFKQSGYGPNSNLCTCFIWARKTKRNSLQAKSKSESRRNSISNLHLVVLPSTIFRKSSMTISGLCQTGIQQSYQDTNLLTLRPKMQLIPEHTKRAILPDT